ncbi:hypothetical protein PsYK624_034060 [Phanerochaete sordida]|uniref:Uncharacterized protein n=1 Tax=Phanerochaete sordida TaxID=48140 RepID=A0A9P3G301_9APHY|nr:hypothetical protein PsYK624_034060 [Phanerochaete sordida]
MSNLQQQFMLSQLQSSRCAAQNHMHFQNVGFANTSLVVVTFRDTELVITRSWLKVNAYEDVMKTFKTHFGRLPHNEDVLAGAGSYESWLGHVFLRLQLASGGIGGMRPMHVLGVPEADAQRPVYDLSVTGAGWPEVVDSIERIYVTVVQR